MSSFAIHDLDEEAELLKLSMQSLKEYYGLNPGKHVKSAKGVRYQLGLELARKLPQTSEDIEEAVKQLAWYWSKNGIGEMFWADREDSLLAIQNCSDCIGVAYGAGYTLCPFKEGLLEAVLETKVHKRFRVRETDCCGTGAWNRVFRVSTLPAEQ